MGINLCVCRVQTVLWCASCFTCVQEQFDHREVGMGHAVVERCVPVAIGQVDDVTQESGRGIAHLSQVEGHCVRLRVLLAGHAKPLLVQHHQDLSLRTHKPHKTKGTEHTS